MSVSNVPSITFTPTGIVIPAESDVLTGTLADIDAAFGGGLNLSLETPQGQLASSEAAIIGDKNAEFAYFVNQVDPQYADGQFQDAIGRIYFMTRIPSAATSVVCTIVGLQGTTVPAGALAQDTNGNTYANSGDVTIGASGSATTTFNNVTTGAIPCPSGTLTKVYQAVPGWDTITNPAAGVLGRDVESRADFEYRRKNSVAVNANGSLPSIYASVFDVANVTDVYVLDNPTNAVKVVGATNYNMIANSLYVAAVGGTDADVAAAIWKRKDVGCSYNGNTTVSITDQSGYSYPYPTYNVTFMRPSAQAIKFAVSIVNNPNLPADIVTQIKNAIIARFNGQDGTSRERIGSSIFASRYYGAVSSLSSAMSIVSIQIGTVTANLAQVLCGVDQAPTLSASDIAVTLV